MAADTLSWPPEAYEGKEDNQDMTLLPEQMFAQTLESTEPTSLDEEVKIS